MFSLLCTVFQWVAESADILLDLANAGRDAQNGFVIAIVSGLAIVRVAAFLLFVIPPAVFLWNLICKKGKNEELRIRVVIIVLIVASVVFEIWASPAREQDAGNETPTEDAYDDYDGM